ncbi:MAG: hypothetical protein ACR2IF_07120 [Terriglobales bacterium]
MRKLLKSEMIYCFWDPALLLRRHVEAKFQHQSSSKRTMEHRYIWCGDQGELEIDIETGEILIYSRPPRKKLAAAEFKALVILARKGGHKCTYSDLLPDAAQRIDKAGRAQGVVCQLNNKLDHENWFRNRLRTISNVPPGEERGYIFTAPVVTGDSRKGGVGDGDTIALEQTNFHSESPDISDDRIKSDWAEKSRHGRKLIEMACAAAMLCAVALLVALRGFDGLKMPATVQKWFVSSLTQTRLGAAIVVANAYPEQPPFEPHMPQSGALEVRWPGVFSVANFEDKAVTIIGFTAEFQPFACGGHQWQLRHELDEPLLAHSFGSPQQLAAYQQMAGGDTHEAPQLVLNPGEKRYYVFDLTFRLFEDGTPCRCWPNVQFVNLLIGGPADSAGKPHRGLVPLRILMKLNDGRIVQTEAQTMLEVNPAGLTAIASR